MATPIREHFIEFRRRSTTIREIVFYETVYHIVGATIDTKPVTHPKSDIRFV